MLSVELEDQVPSPQVQLLGSSVQLAHRHFVPGPNMWARVNLVLQVHVHSSSHRLKLLLPSELVCTWLAGQWACWERPLCEPDQTLFLVDWRKHLNLVLSGSKPGGVRVVPLLVFNPCGLSCVNDCTLYVRPVSYSISIKDLLLFLCRLLNQTSENKDSSNTKERILNPSFLYGSLPFFFGT